MSLINRGRMEIKLGEYAVGPGTVLTDPNYVSTNATLDYMSVQRDLARAGI